MNPPDSGAMPALGAAATAAGPDDEILAAPDLSVLRANRLPAPVLPLDVFGERWHRWIEGAAQASACPVDYVAAPLLAAASAAIGNARWVQATPGWCEPPHLWCASIGDPGSGKSRGADSLHRHVLREIERRMAADHPERLQTHRAEAQLVKEQREQWEQEVRMAARYGRELPLPPSDVGPEPAAPRMVQSDVTVEKVAALLASAAPKGVLMVQDELAEWLLSTRAGSDPRRRFWLEAYSGRTHQMERVKRPEPIVIPHLAVAWSGGIEPARLAEIMREADDSLLARFCWFWPEPAPFGIGINAPDTPFAIEAFERLRLLAMQPAESADGAPSPVIVPLADAARAHLIQFAREMEARGESADGLMRLALGKARGLALRLSLVLAHLWWSSCDAGTSPPDEIPASAFAAAAALVDDYLIPTAERTYGDAVCSASEWQATTLARWIDRHRPAEVHVRRMLREVRLPGLMEAAHVHEAAQALSEAGWLLPMRGRPNGAERARAAYPINPRLYEVLKA